MALGPFISYVPPGVYTRTLTEANAAAITAGLRIPVVVGVGQEELTQSDVEIVRGSSATVDQQINNEDVSTSWVVNSTNPQNLILGTQDGTRTMFRVRNYPIVDGQGFGRVTNDTRTVTVTVNGVPVAVGGVNGQKGLITLQVPTQPTDHVLVTYYFHRGDTSFTDDVSAQVSSSPARLTTPGYAPFEITTGSNDTFNLTVNGFSYSVTFAAGTTTAAGLKTQLDAALIPNFSTAVTSDNNGLDHLTFTATQSIVIGDGNANGPLGLTPGTATNRTTTFQVFNRPIVDGSGGGTTTTDTSKVTVKVNNVQVIPTSVDGANGKVTLPFAPTVGSTVTITYWANTWQDTFDYLPNTLVTSVIRCGISPGRADYIQGQDFVISNPSADTSIVHWGTSVAVTAGTTSPGSEPFDNTQIIPSLNDDQMFLGECDRFVDNTVIPAAVSSTQFYLPEVPTTGNGRNTTLGLPLYNAVTNGKQDVITNRPDLVVVRTGRNLRDALNRTAATVLSVDGASRLITLKDPVPPDHIAFATFYYNRIVDDTYLLTCLVPGPIGSGQYSVFSTTQNTNLYQVRFGTKSGLPQIVQWPRGVEQIPDAFHAGTGTPVSETVTVTFGTEVASNAAYTNKGQGPWSFYSPYSANWTTRLNGTSYLSNLASAAPAVLVGGHVTPIQVGPDTGKINITILTNALNLRVDGTVYPVSLTTGARTPAQIAAEIDAAVGAAVTGYVQIGPITGDVVFFITSPTTPGVLPGGLDDVSTLRIESGTAESSLGFAAFQAASGTVGAVNKAATLLGTIAGPFNITAGLNDVFKVRHNGTDFTVVLPNGSSVTTAAVAAQINLTVGASIASAATGVNLDQLRLVSTLNDANSTLVILDGDANATLGFSVNQSASQTLVDPQEVVNVLMQTAGFTTDGFAYVSEIDGGRYITIESTTVGLSTSSVAFVNSGNSAFNSTTGVNITPGIDGDNGEDAQEIFTVTSNNASGSSGTGIPGQTYTDAVTGLRFTVLPASTGTYNPGGSFTLTVSPTFVVDPSRPFYAVPGLETTVYNTVNVAVNDTASLQTYTPGGVEPAVGDFYFITYRYMKQDYTTRLYRQLKSIEAAYGKASSENRVSLAAYLAILNGAILVGVKQVLKVPNTNQASDQSFITAIDELATPLPGNIKPDIIVPLATSTAVYSYLTQHVEIQSNIRNQSERMGFIGFASGTTPLNAQSIAKSLNSNRIVAFYPDSVVITLTDELGQSYEQLVDGSFFAAAASGAVVSPAVDVATPYTRRQLQGFTRIPRILDPVEANQTAVAGITLLEDLDPIIRIRQGLTTNMANVLTRLPTVTQIADFVQQQSRIVLDSFIGTKFLASRTNEVNVTMTSLFKDLVQAEIVGAFTGISSSIDTDDPTVLRFEAYYQPIFPLLYIVLTFNLRARL